MSFLGSSLKNRETTKLYAEYDHNPYAIAEIVLESYKKIKELEEAGELDKGSASYFFKILKMGPKFKESDLPLRTEAETKKYTFLMSRLEAAQERYEGVDYIPVDELKVYRDIAKAFKNFLGRSYDNHINIPSCVEDIVNTLATKHMDVKEFEDTNMYDVFDKKEDNTISPEEKFQNIKEIMSEHLIDNVKRFKMQVSSKMYVKGENLLGEKAYLSVGDVMDIFPVFQSGLPIEVVFTNSNLSNMTLSNIDINATIDKVVNNNVSSHDEDMNKYSYSLFQDKIGYQQLLENAKELVGFGGSKPREEIMTKNEIVELKKTLELFVLDKIVQVTAYKDYVAAGDYDVVIKKIQENFTKLLNNISSREKMFDENSDGYIKRFAKQFLEGVEDQTINKNFLDQKSKLKVIVNQKTFNSSYNFESNYSSVRAIMAKIMGNEADYFAYIGSAGIGKTYDIGKIIELFGGTFIQQKNIMVQSAMESMNYGDKEISSAKEDRTNTITNLHINRINGDVDKTQVLLLDEFHAVLDKPLSTEGNGSFTSSGLLGPLEAMGDNKKFIVANAFGQEIELRSANSVSVATGNNFTISSKTNPQAVRRMKAVYQENAYFTSKENVKKMIFSTMFSSNIDKYLQNFNKQTENKIDTVLKVLMDSISKYPLRKEMLDVLTNNKLSNNEKIIEMNKINTEAKRNSESNMSALTIKSSKTGEGDIRKIQLEHNNHFSNSNLEVSEKFLYFKEFFELSKKYKFYVSEFIKNHDPKDEFVTLKSNEYATERLRIFKAIETLVLETNMKIDIDGEINDYIKEKYLKNPDYILNPEIFSYIVKKYHLKTEDLNIAYKTFDVLLMNGISRVSTIDTKSSNHSDEGPLNKMKNHLREDVAMPYNDRDIVRNDRYIKKYMPYQVDVLNTGIDSKLKTLSPSVQNEILIDKLAGVVSLYNYEINQTFQLKKEKHEIKPFKSAEVLIAGYALVEKLTEAISGDGVINEAVIVALSSIDSKSMISKLAAAGLTTETRADPEISVYK